MSDRRVFLAPFGLEFRQGLLGLDVIYGLINSLEILGDVFAILPSAEVQGMAHQMHDTRLDGIDKLTGSILNRTKPYDKSQTIRGL